MSRVNAQARIRGFPRERKSGPSKLSKELQKKRRVLRINATMGIFGMPNSGKKTLAYRLANMDRGAFRGVPVACVYSLIYRRRHEPRDCMSYARFLITVNMYIIPNPEMPPRITRSGATQNHDPPLYLEHWKDFCCMAFAFDVKRKLTFDFILICLSTFSLSSFRVPACFLVGNKCDLRSEPPPLDPQSRAGPVPEETARREAENLGATYFELSAKYKINVAPLHRCILEKAILDRENWQPDP